MLNQESGLSGDFQAVQDVQTAGMPDYSVPSSVTEQALTTFLKNRDGSGLTEEQKRALPMPFEIGLRSEGRLLICQWLEGHSPYRAMHELLLAEPKADSIQLSIAVTREEIGADDWRRRLTREKNGRYGLEVTLNGASERVSPLITISTNRPLERWFQKYLERKALGADEFFDMGGRMALLECRQFLLKRSGPTAALETYRANRLVPRETDVEDRVDELIAGISRWFSANQREDGALPYKYWPSAGAYSLNDNPIRQFMASVVLNRLARFQKSERIRSAARMNLQYNLGKFFRAVDGYGEIFWDGSVKLGAVAIAAQAILESSFRHVWDGELTLLRKTIDKLWQPSGAFRTFAIPAERNDNQNFYPGEALTFWAASLAQEPDPELLGRAMTSIAHYRKHFRGKPNPAFVPWHSQAAATLYKLTGERSLRDYVFEMNDWLLLHQQWGGDLDLDHWGRFYTPDRPDYGPPHASATGVYLEGLVDALELAQGMGDSVRAELYLTAITRGAQSIRQLQFADFADTFYIAHPERVSGAIRTETDNNEIRIDNMQHALAALLKFKSLSATSKSARRKN